jgi:hypothetical protein
MKDTSAYMGKFMKVVDGQYNVQRCYHGNPHQETFSGFNQLPYIIALHQLSFMKDTSAYMGKFMKMVDGQYNVQRCYHGNPHQETFSGFNQLPYIIALHQLSFMKDTSAYMGNFMKVVDGQYNVQRCYHGNPHQETFSSFNQLPYIIALHQLSFMNDTSASR